MTDLHRLLSLLVTQIDQTVLSGMNKVFADQVLAAPASYQVFGYMGTTDWDDLGHVTGAFQVTPGSLDLDALSMFDPASPIAVYCWSGHSSSMIAAWLNVLGYDSVSVANGANGMIYDDLELRVP